MSKYLAIARKAVVAAVGVTALLVSEGVLSGQPLAVAQAVIAVATAFGVWRVPNAAPLG